MLEAERPDVVHIATPPQSHLPLAMTALDAGCHVFVEKPLTLCHADSQRLVTHAISCNRKLTVGYGYYFDPIARTMRNLIADGLLGDTVHVESFLGYALSGPFGSSIFGHSGHWVHQLPGKLIHNVIDHLLNKLAEFVSEEPTVYARAWQRAADRHPTCSMPDELRMMLFDGEMSAFATFSSHARPVAHFLNVYGTKKTAHLDFETGTIVLSSTAALPGAIGRLAAPLARDFSTCVKVRRTCSDSPDPVLRSCRIQFPDRRVLRKRSAGRAGTYSLSGHAEGRGHDRGCVRPTA